MSFGRSFARAPLDICRPHRRILYGSVGYRRVSIQGRRAFSCVVPPSIKRAFIDIQSNPLFRISNLRHSFRIVPRGVQLLSAVEAIIIWSVYGSGR